MALGEKACHTFESTSFFQGGEEHGEKNGPPSQQPPKLRVADGNNALTVEDTSMKVDVLFQEATPSLNLSKLKRGTR